MDGLEILSTIFAAIVVFSVLLVVFWVLGFSGLASRSPWGLRLVFVVLATAPWWGNLPATWQHDRQQRQRAAEVASLPRVPPPVIPETLLAFQFLNERAIARLLDERPLDRVLVAQVSPDSDPVKLQAWTRSPEGALEVEKREVPAADLPEPRWVLLEGRDTHHWEGTVLWYRGNLELRLVDGEADVLVDYWEDYYSRKPWSLLCPAVLPWCWSATHGAERTRSTLDFLLDGIPSGA